MEKIQRDGKRGKKDEEASSWLGEAWSAKRVGNGAERRASGWSGTASRGRFGHVRERGGRDESGGRKWPRAGGKKKRAKERCRHGQQDRGFAVADLG